MDGSEEKMSETIGAYREKTVKDRIYDLSKRELVHDYDAELKTIFKLLDDEKAKMEKHYADEIRKCEKEMIEQKIIISCLVAQIQRGGCCKIR